MTRVHSLRDNADMSVPTIDLTPMRNATSHAYDEVKAQAVAGRAAAFASDAVALLDALGASLAT